MKQASVAGSFLHIFFRCSLRALIPVILLGLLVGEGILTESAFAAAKKRTASVRKTASKTAAKKRAPARKTTAKKRKSTAKRATTARRARTVRRRAPTRAARFRGQQAPTSARLMEIQQALQKGGFLQGEPNGRWDDASAGAMKRFQEEHDIAPSGKINALSLMALGLGPKRGPAPGATSVLETPPAADPAPATETNERR
ncbi:MAG: peptidoglycan-binding protein [Bryobacterales bacterium]|nr:peptidoglycan-binding protein [Bryobacterales bacterium]